MRSLLPLAPALLLAGCGTSRPVSHDAPEPARALVLIPSQIEDSGRLPGEHPYPVEIRNVSRDTLRNVGLAVSCGCMRLDPPEAIGTLRPGESRRVRLFVRVDAERPVRQSVEAKATGVRGLSLRVAVTADPVLPRGADLKPLALARNSPGEPGSRTSIAFPVNRRVQRLAIDCDAPWLKIEGRVASGLWKGTARAMPGAPEGEFRLPLRLRFVADGAEGEDVARIGGRVSSQMRLSADVVSFGVLRIGTPVTRDVTLRGSALRAPVSVATGDPAVTARATVVPEGVRVKLTAHPSREGDLAGVLRIRTGKLSAKVSYSGYVLRP